MCRILLLKNVLGPTTAGVAIVVLLMYTYMGGDDLWCGYSLLLLL